MPWEGDTRGRGGRKKWRDTRSQLNNESVTEYFQQESGAEIPKGYYAARWENQVTLQVRLSWIISLGFKEKTLLSKSLSQFHRQVSQVRRSRGRCSRTWCLIVAANYVHDALSVDGLWAVFLTWHEWLLRTAGEFVSIILWWTLVYIITFNPQSDS